ncbi:hypothetical protein D9Q98_003565 [Chlorella vulgaris]|uniref:Uncharacterized protein n=1 Tax=Chlorella vulgaris TaxID=3077 RepID=A0A9D4YYX1_CHLVU|nr:hypothetical protein D9Q98_003565 [Chlorella vulgaris]
MRPVNCVAFVESASCKTSASTMHSPDLLFSMEDAEVDIAATGDQVPFQQSAAAAADALHQLQRLLQPNSDVEAMLTRHVELAVGGAHRVAPDALCAVLQRLGYSAKLHESSVPLHKFKNGVRHQYITVCLPNTGSTGLSSFVVEANFRDSFCVAHPTPRFAAVLDGLPNAVVANKVCFHRAVSLLSREMALSFLDRGEDVPPWRTAQALLSRWHLSGAGTLSSGPGGCSTWERRGQAQHPAGPAGALCPAKPQLAVGAE